MLVICVSYELKTSTNHCKDFFLFFSKHYGPLRRIVVDWIIARILLCKNPWEEAIVEGGEEVEMDVARCVIFALHINHHHNDLNTSSPTNCGGLGSHLDLCQAHWCHVCATYAWPKVPIHNILLAIFSPFIGTLNKVRHSIPRPPGLGRWSGRFLGIIGWDPSVCKSNWLHINILRFSFIKLG